MQGLADICSLFSVKLESPCFDLAASGRYLFAVTTTCQARVYDTKSSKIKSFAASIAHLAEPDLATIDICENGTPVLLSTGSDAFAYDADLQSWVPICESRLLEHDVPKGRETEGTLSRIEQDCRATMKTTANGHDADPEWWQETQQMTIMEMRMKGSILLGSLDEYRYWLSQYATFVARQEFIGRAEELLQDLIGPLYQSVLPVIPVRGSI